MARTEARIKCDIWDDEDFRSLTWEAQWLYHAILEQKDLSLCGVLTWTPKRFAKLASNASATATKKALELLRSRRYVVVDEDTDELWVRTLIQNDRVLDNHNSIVGMSNAFGAIHSKVIRDALVEGVMKGVGKGVLNALPQGVQDRLSKPFVQALALASARPPPHPPIPPASSLQPPATPSVVDKSSSSNQGVVDEAPEEEELREKANDAAMLVARRRLEVRDGPPITNPTAWLRRTAEGVLNDHRGELLAFACNGLSAVAIADQIMPLPGKRYADAGEDHSAWTDDDVTIDEHGHLVVSRRAG